MLTLMILHLIARGKKATDFLLCNQKGQGVKTLPH